MPSLVGDAARPAQVGATRWTTRLRTSSFVLDAVGQPAFLLGHSYGAVCALGAAVRHPDGVRKLVLYEHPHPTLVAPSILAILEQIAESADWDKLVETFMRDVLRVPSAEVKAIKTTPFWQVWTADAEATLNDLRALSGHRFEASHYRSLNRPVQLLIGTESPRELRSTLQESDLPGHPRPGYRAPTCRPYRTREQP